MSAPHPIGGVGAADPEEPLACPADAVAIREGRISERWTGEIRVSARKLARNSTIDISLAEDLFSAGLAALWHAAQAFDPTRGTPFNHFARRCIRNAMLSELRWFQHPTCTARSRPFDESVPARYGVCQLTGPCERTERREAVRSWIAGCPERLQQIFDLLYERGLTQREAAEIMQVSQPRVSQYHQRLIMQGRMTLGALLAA